MLNNKEKSREKIEIIDIYWDRIYLHIKLAGDLYEDDTFAIVKEKEERNYPLRMLYDRKEIVINITNVYEQEMLGNGKWYLMIKGKKSDEWKHIPVRIDLCYRLQEKDKIYRYRGDAYAYVYSFTPIKKHEIFICEIQTTFMMKNCNVKKSHFTLEANKTSTRMVKFTIHVLEMILNIMYQCVSRISRKNGKRILLMSETRDMGGNLKALDDRLKERGLDKTLEISYSFCKTLEKPKTKIFFIWLKLVLLTAKQDYIFVDDYAPFFDFIKLDSRTKLIQVWHAGVGFKSVGYARFGKKGSPHPYNTSHRKYDYAIVGGEALRDVYAEVFGIDRDKCLPYGLMRNDGYLDAGKIEDFKKEFWNNNPGFKDKKVILFAPTFRGVNQRNAFFPYEILEQDKIYRMCGEKYIFLIKMHPFVREKIAIDENYKERIVDFSDYPDINKLFYVTDILITDYSSNIYEYSMLRRPIVFWAYDKEEYELVRSVHRSLDDSAPGKVCENLDDVLETINEEDFELDKLDRFVRDNFDDLEGNAADKVIDNILFHK